MSRLIEVWGDTVDSRHMSGAIALGVGVATPVFLGAEWLFAGAVEDPTLGRSYALLAGLAACILAAVIAARLFPPKRIVRETVATEEGRRQALDDIVAEGGEWTDPADLPDETRGELRALGLYELLVKEHARRVQGGANHASTTREESAASKAGTGS